MIILTDTDHKRQLRAVFYNEKGVASLYCF